MSLSQDGLRTLLREELESALSGVRNDVEKLQSSLSDVIQRVQSLERSPSPWPSPRSAIRSNQSTSEPPRKSSRSTVGFSPRATSDDHPVSNDTVVLNTFPDKVSRDEIKEWLAPLVTMFVGDAEYTVTSRSKYCSRVFVRFVSPARAKAFSLAWRKEPRHFKHGDHSARIYLNWKCSPSRAKDEYLMRRFFEFAKDVLQLQPAKLEKEKSTRTIYFDRILLARVDHETVTLTTAGKAYADIAKFQTWLAEKEDKRPHL